MLLGWLTPHTQTPKSTGSFLALGSRVINGFDQYPSKPCLQCNVCVCARSRGEEAGKEGKERERKEEDKEREEGKGRTKGGIRKPRPGCPSPKRNASTRQTTCVDIVLNMRSPVDTLTHAKAAQSHPGCYELVSERLCVLIGG